MNPLRIGSRGSKLALWQAHFIRDEIARLHGVAAEIVIIKTSGDRFQQGAVDQIGLKGVFIKELEDSLLAREVDLAVHSMKDVPTEIPGGLAFPAIYRRADVRDCLVARHGMKFTELPKGARVGTSSLRRQAQLLHLRPDLAVLELRGNVDTRLRKLDEGQYDAIVLAKAGLDRLGWSEKIADVFSAERLLPAVGQGALGIECRTEDARVVELLGKLDDAETRASVTAERALLARLEGGCQVPLGAWGRIEDGTLRLDAIVLAADGTEHLRESALGSPENAEALGCQLAEKLLHAGAGRLLQLAGRTIHAANTKPLEGKRIVVTRAAEQAGEMVRALEESGATVLRVPSVAFAAAEDKQPLDAAILSLLRFDWLLLTSQNAVRFFAARCRDLGINLSALAGAPPSIAAVGLATADAARREGLVVQFVASRNTGEGLAQELREHVLGKRVLLPRSDRAPGDLPAALSRNGAQVTDVVAYRTLALQGAAAKELEQVRQGAADVLTFASPSAFHSFVDQIGAEVLRQLSGRTAIAAIGPVTARSIQKAGFEAAIVAEDSSAAGLVAAIISWSTHHTPLGAKTP